MAIGWDSFLHGLTCVVVAGALGASAVHAAQCTPQWLPEFGARPGMDAGVSALGEFDLGNGPQLYAAGDFTVAGGVSAQRVARWDGAAWSPLGNGLNSSVFALALHDDGSGQALYAAGQFGLAVGSPAVNVARWDGAAWSAVGLGTNGRVNALSVFDDGSGPALYAAGLFTEAGGVPALNIAKWNGSTWSALGAGLDGSGRALAVYDDGAGPALYAAGRFLNAGGVAASKVAKWNGTTWSALGAGLQGSAVPSPSFFQVSALSVFDDGSGSKLYVGGSFTGAGGAPASNIARWDGATWSALGVGVQGSVGALLAHDDGAGAGLFVGGQFSAAGGGAAENVAVWRGGAWSALSGAFPVSVLALAAFDDGSGARLCAGGASGFTTPEQHAFGYIAAWDGASWSPFTRGLSGAVQALVVHDDGAGEQLFVSGHFVSAAAAPAEPVMRWNGATWSATNLPFDNVPTCFEAFDDGLGGGVQLYAGSLERVVGSTLERGIARWDGASWNWINGFIGSVSSMVAHDDGSGPALYVGGVFTTLPGGVPSNHIARFDGTSWSPVGAGFDSFVHALEVFDDGSGPALYAAGVFTQSGATPAARIAKWDGASWSALGSGPGGVAFPQIWSLEVFDAGAGAALYVGGRFETAGGQPASGIASWDGVNWSALGAGLGGGSANALRTFDVGTGPALYVAGSFVNAGGLPASNCASWNGTSWSTLGPGLSGSGTAAEVFDDGGGPALFVGGVFNAAPESGDSFLAKWGCDALATVTYCTAGTTSNGCLPAIATSGVPSASASTGFDLSATQLEGQRQGLFFYSLSGPSASAWGASLLCVKSPTQRMGAQSSGGVNGQCDGVFLTDWNAFRASHPSALGQPFSGGETVWAQAWFRDPPAPKSTNLSNAVRFSVAP